MSTETPLPRSDWYAIAPAARGDWLELIRLAVCHGNAGVIDRCGAWATAHWRAWGLTRHRVDVVVSVGLAEWIGAESADLSVKFFDISFEEAWKKSSESAAEGPKNRGKGSRPPSAGPSRPPSAEGERRSRSEIPEREDGREGGSGASARPLVASPLGNVTGPAGPDPNLKVALEAIGQGFTSAKGTGAGAPPLAAADISAHGRELVDFVAENSLELLVAVARLFYTRDGRKPGDTYWRESGWSLHLLVTQGLQTLRLVAKAPRGQRNVRVGHVRAEDNVHTGTGTVDLDTGVVTTRGTTGYAAPPPAGTTYPEGRQAIPTPRGLSPPRHDDARARAAIAELETRVTSGAAHGLPGGAP